MSYDALKDLWYLECETDRMNVVSSNQSEYKVVECLCESEFAKSKGAALEDGPCNRFTTVSWSQYQHHRSQ